MEISNLKEAVMSYKNDSNWNSNWDECIEITLSLLQKIPSQSCKQIAFDYVEEYYGAFQQHHPQASWIRTRLLTIQEGILEDSKIGDFILPDMDSEFATPGSNGFIKLLEDLWELVNLKQSKSIPQEATFIISGIIICKLDNRWGSEQPSEWNAWLQAGRDGLNDLGIDHRIKFLQSMSVRSLNVQEWITLANRLKTIIEK